MAEIGITADQLNQEIQNKTPVLILDLRPKEQYAEGHIDSSANAVCESTQQKQAVMSKLPGNFKIILVDDGSGEAQKIATMMARFGYAANYLIDGIKSWQGNLVKSSQDTVISGDKLYESIKGNDDVFLLDVREPMEFSEHKIPGAVNIPLSQLFIPGQEPLIPKDKKVVTICSHGNRSLVASFALAKQGIEASSLSGGMSRWNQVLSDTIAVKEDDITVIQVEKVGKGCLSHIIGSDGEAAVIDPTTPATKYQEFATKYNLKITKVIDTHQHADHVSAAKQLADQTGATLYLSEIEEYGIPSEKLNDGVKIPVGKTHLDVIHTPGHTAGSMSFVLDKKYLFSGDILFIDSIGRPDLRDKAEEFAGQLHDTLHNKLLKFPEETKIFPTHHSESIQPTKDGVYYTTVKIAKQLPILDLSKEEFVSKVVGMTTQRPMNYSMIIKVNKGIIPVNPMMIPELEMGHNRCSVG